MATKAHNTGHLGILRGQRPNVNHAPGHHRGCAPAAAMLPSP
jgi:hypothetical protein